MPFGCLIRLIVLFFALFLTGSSDSIWSGGGFGTGRPRNRIGRLFGRDEDDFEIRRKMRHAHERTPVYVEPDDPIEVPDADLEELIAQGKLKDARKYRDDMAKIAEEMCDEQAQRKYAIYGARISRLSRTAPSAAREPVRPAQPATIQHGEPAAAGVKANAEARKIKVADEIGTVKDKPPDIKTRPPLWKLTRSAPLPEARPPSVEPKPVAPPVSPSHHGDDKPVAPPASPSHHGDDKPARPDEYGDLIKL